jgi:gliding motility-associated-like protein
MAPGNYIDKPTCWSLSMPIRLGLTTLFCIIHLTATHAQCADYKTFLPDPKNDTNDGYGSSHEVYGDYLVVGAYANDSLEVNSGIAYLYKLNVQNQWSKVAELVPSDPHRHTKFGYHVRINGNTIAVWSELFDEIGNRYSRIFIYEKSEDGEWLSGTETYRLDISTQTNYVADIALEGDELIASASVGGMAKVLVYRKSNNVFSLVQELQPPLNPNGGFGRIALNDDIIYITSDQFVNSDKTLGALFLFEKVNGVYTSAPFAKLTPSNLPANLHIGFGVSLFVEGDVIAVAASYVPDGSASYSMCIYIYEKAGTRWTDATESYRIKSDELLFLEQQVYLTGDYIFIRGSDSQHLTGFKKIGSSWSEGSQSFTINNPFPENEYFAHHISFTNNHLLVSVVDNVNDFQPGSQGIIDYFSPNAQWESSPVLNQFVTERTINSTQFVFGETIKASKNWLAISAPKEGHGAVYIFNLNNGQKEKKIAAPDEHQPGKPGFGYAIAMTDSTLFISAVYHDSLSNSGSVLYEDMGKVYVYHLSGSVWKYHSTIFPPAPGNKLHFGQSITCTENYVAVTEYFRFSGKDVGRIHMFKKSSAGRYEFLATLKPSTEQKGRFFGETIFMEDSLLVATSNYDDDKVFIYNRKGEWTNSIEDAFLMPMRCFSMDTRDGYIVIGDFTSHTAKIYKKPTNGWKGLVSPIATLSPSVKETWDYFGSSVAISTNSIFVGSPYSMTKRPFAISYFVDKTLAQPGSVYRFDLKGAEWTSSNKEDQRLQSVAPESIDGYGSAVLLSEGRLIVASKYDDTAAGHESGSVQMSWLSAKVRELPDPICKESESVKLIAYPSGGTWTGDGVNTTTGILNLGSIAPGNYEVTYTINGCTDSTEINIVSGIGVTAMAPLDHLKCMDGSVRLFVDSDQDAARYAWFSEEDGIYKLINSGLREITVNEPGKYQVRINHQYCKPFSQDFSITNETSVEIVIDPVPTICSNSNILLKAAPEGGTWSGAIVNSVGEIDGTVPSDGSYEINYAVVTALGCRFEKTTSIFVDKLAAPSVVQTGDKVCHNEPVVLEVNNEDPATTVTWYNYEEGEALTNSNEMKFIAKQPGIYFAEVQKHGCKLRSADISIMAGLDSLYIPNVFTPNSDSYNDYFEIVAVDLYNFKLSIVNRYGESIYTTRDTKFKWDGEGISSGVYFWHLEYTNCDDKVRKYKGWVHLIR